MSANITLYITSPKEIFGSSALPQIFCLFCTISEETDVIRNGMSLLLLFTFNDVVFTLL